MKFGEEQVTLELYEGRGVGEEPHIMIKGILEGSEAIEACLKPISLSI